MIKFSVEVRMLLNIDILRFLVLKNIIKFYFHSSLFFFILYVSLYLFMKLYETCFTSLQLMLQYHFLTYCQHTHVTACSEKIVDCIT